MLDIKPYVPFCDSVPAAAAPHWVAMRVRWGAALLEMCWEWMPLLWVLCMSNLQAGRHLLG